MELQQGQVVWADVPDHHGNIKDRPVVILSSPKDSASTGIYVGIAVTTSVPSPLPATHVELPWHRDGNVRTGLRERCAAVCNWLIDVREADIRRISGLVPGKILKTIAEKVRSFEQAEPGMPPDGSSGEVRTG